MCARTSYEARQFPIRNVALLKGLVSAQASLIGIKPSAILSFRDEYPDLMPTELKTAAQSLAHHALLVDEFIAREAEAGRIRSEPFLPRARAIKLHGHCHQKTLSSLAPAVRTLELPAGHKAQVISSGCCGMAGSFGYQAEHFKISQQIGELVFFPAARSCAEATMIAASVTSCRHQIKDATRCLSYYLVEVLHAAIRY